MENIIDLNLYIYLEYNDYINLIICNKLLYNYYKNINCESFYKHLLTLNFSDKFTEKIYPIVNSYKLSFLSINKFETTLKKHNFNKLNEEDYYLIWKKKYNYNIIL